MDFFSKFIILAILIQVLLFSFSAKKPIVSILVAHFLKPAGGVFPFQFLTFCLHFIIFILASYKYDYLVLFIFPILNRSLDFFLTSGATSAATSFLHMLQKVPNNILHLWYQGIETLVNFVAHCRYWIFQLNRPPISMAIMSLSEQYSQSISNFSL